MFEDLEEIDDVDIDFNNWFIKTYYKDKIKIKEGLGNYKTSEEVNLASFAIGVNYYLDLITDRRDN